MLDAWGLKNKKDAKTLLSRDQIEQSPVAIVQASSTCLCMACVRARGRKIVSSATADKGNQPTPPTPCYESLTKYTLWMHTYKRTQGTTGCQQVHARPSHCCRGSVALYALVVLLRRVLGCRYGRWRRWDSQSHHNAADGASLSPSLSLSLMT